VVPLCDLPLTGVRKLRSMFLRVPDRRAKKGRDYSLPCLPAIMALSSYRRRDGRPTRTAARSSSYR